mgnify:CR=1 FL=1
MIRWLILFLILTSFIFSQLTLTETEFSNIQIRGEEKASGNFKINVQTKVVQVGWESTPVLSEAVTVTLKVNAIASICHAFKLLA